MLPGQKRSCPQLSFSTSSTVVGMTNGSSGCSGARPYWCSKMRSAALQASGPPLSKWAFSTDGATVIALPLGGAPARASGLESVTFGRTRAEGIR